MITTLLINISEAVKAQPLWAFLSAAMLVDWLLALIVAFKNKTISSKIGRDGLSKKVMTILALLLIQFGGYIATLIPSIEFSIPAFEVIALVYITYEIISINETLAKAGIKTLPLGGDSNG